LSGHRDGFFRSISGLTSYEEPIIRVPSETAAVAVMFGEGAGGEEVLLIKRSDREGDPWSGQVCLPGGRVEKEDSSFMATAVRETQEEVGIDLDADARFIGYLGSFQARKRSIWVVPSVFMLVRLPVVTPNLEVASFKWMPFREILATEHRSTYKLNRGGELHVFPALDLEGYLVWGLTERILSTLAGAAQTDASTA
jgi:8-oxo-dGTP pyrophosphatase MutT (NUDIX family)